MKNVQKYYQKLAEEHPKEEQANSPYKMKYNSIHVHPKRSKCLSLADLQLPNNRPKNVGASMEN
jgi:hypothetical protein